MTVLTQPGPSEPDGPDAGGAPPGAPPRAAANPRLRCVRCRYDLSGTSPDANCPECGLSAWMSAEGYKLKHAPREYLRILHRGFVVLVIANVLKVAMLVYAALAELWSESRAITIDETAREMFRAALLGWTVSFAVLLVGVVGMCLVTSPDSTGAEFGHRPRVTNWLSLRRLVRWSWIGYLVGFLVFAAFNTLWLANLLSLYHAPWIAIDVSLFAWLMLSGVAIGIGVLAAAMLYVRSIALRLPDRRLAAWATRFIWLVPLCGLLELVAASASETTEWLAIDIMQGCLSVAPTVGLLALDNALRRRLHAVRDEAELQNRPVDLNVDAA